MSQPPTPFEIETLHAGDVEHTPEVADHVAACDACAAYVETLDRERAALLAREDPADFARRLRLQADAAPAHGTVWLPRLVGGLLAAGLAAVVLVVAPPTDDPTPTGPTVTAPTPRPTAAPEPVRLKGADVRVALIVLRDGVQRRYTRPVTLRPGDRVRVEVAAAQATTVQVGILVDDGSWLEMMEASPLDAGTHVLPKTVTVDSDPMKATVLAGPPEAIAAVRAGGTPDDGLATLAVETEVAP